MKVFLTQLQQDPETYSLFLEEAKSRGLYQPKKLQNQTLDYARKGYYENFIARDNKSFEVNREEEIKKFILYKEKQLTRAERVQIHLEKLLDPQEKVMYNYVPPNKEEFPLAFSTPSLIRKKKSLNPTHKTFNLDDFLRRQYAQSRPRRIREDASFELYTNDQSFHTRNRQHLFNNTTSLPPLMPLTIENLKIFEQMTKHNSGPVDMGFNLTVKPQSQKSKEQPLVKKQSQRDVKSKYQDDSQKNPRSIRQNTLMAKSIKKSDKPQKGEVIEDEKELLISKRKGNKEDYEIILDRENEELINHFKLMCQDQDLRKAKLTRGKFKAFLTIRYKGAITDRIINFFTPFFTQPMNYSFFCDVFERLINPQQADRIKRMVHGVYDFNGDRYIDELDVYCFIQTFEADNPQLFMSVYLDDVMKIIQGIERKKNLKGFQNRDMDVKLQKIKEKAAKAGQKAQLGLVHVLKDAVKSAFDGMKNEIDDIDGMSLDRPESATEEEFDDESEEDSLIQELQQEDEKQSYRRRNRFRSRRSNGSNNSYRTTKTTKTTRTTRTTRTTKTTKTTKTSRTNRTQKSRRSQKTKTSNHSYKTTRTVKTAKPPFGRRSSVRSAKSKKSMRSNRSGRSQGNEESDDDNPHYKIIGKQFVKGMKKQKTYIEKLTQSDFKNISFEYGNIPKFALDFFKYVVLFDIKQHYEDKKTNQQDQKKEEIGNPIVLEMQEWSNKLGEKPFNKIFRGFRCLSKYGDDETVKDYQLFVTEKSIQRNFSKLFGYKNEFLASRIYSIMSGNVKDKRIFFPQYIQTLNRLLYGNEYVKQRFIFQLYDIDNDGILNGYDIVQFYENIIPSSIIGEEIGILAKHYVNTQLRAVFKRDSDILGITTFNNLILRSCLIDELRQRFTSKPGKEWTFSVFQGRNLPTGSNQNELKKLIYGNLRMFKPVKRVTWKGLPPIEEDEKRQNRKKMLKDAPKGVEHLNQEEEEPIEKEEEEITPQSENKNNEKKNGKNSVDQKGNTNGSTRNSVSVKNNNQSQERRNTLKFGTTNGKTKLSTLINSRKIIEKMSIQSKGRSSVKLKRKT